MDPSTYSQLMVQALMGGLSQPGLSSSATSQNPTTASGQSFITGNPTAPGGMLPNSPGAINPNTQQGAAAMNQPAAAGSWGAFEQNMAPYTQNAYPPGQNPFQIAGNQQLQQPFSTYPGMMMPPPQYGDGGGGQAQ